MASVLQQYHQLADRMATQITGSYQSWTDFLTTAARLYKYPYHEQLMIYAQRPEATACAEYDLWNNRMGRYIRRGAKGIALIDHSGDAPKLKYVFDVADTRSTERSRSPYLWEYRSEHEKVVSNALGLQYSIQYNGDFADQLEQISSVRVTEYFLAHEQDLLGIVDGSYLERYHDYDKGVAFLNAATVSTTYMLLSRCDLAENAHFGPEDFMPVFDFNTPQTVDALGSAISGISEEILRTIEVTIKKYEREKLSERSQDNERTDLHTQRGLLDSQSEPVPPGEQTSGQVRTDAESIPSGASPGAVEPPDPDGEAVSPSAGDRRNSEPAVGADDAHTDAVVRSDGSSESQRPHEMGGADEQPEIPSRGSDPDGVDLHLTEDSPVEQFSFFPTEAQQSESITEVERVQATPSAFSMFISQADIDHILRTGGNEDDARMKIVAEFSKQKPLENRATFLKALYHGGNGLITENGKISAWYGEGGIHIASGDTARYLPAAQVISWADAAGRTEELLDSGTFATNLEVAEAPRSERQRIAAEVWDLYHNLSDEAKSLGHLSCLLYQVGDFFEMYGEDARQAELLLDLNLTSRNIPDVGRVTMCGIPAHSLEQYVEKLRDKYDVTIAATQEDSNEHRIYTLPSIDHKAENAINAYEAEFGADGTSVFRDPAAEQPHQPTVRELFDRYKLAVGNALSKDTAFVNACRNSDRQNAYLEGADAIRRIVTASDNLQLVHLYFDMPAFHNRLHQELLEELYPTLATTVAPSPYKVTQEDIDDALQKWNGNPQSKQAVVRYMEQHGREKDTALWLAKEYGAGDTSQPLQISVGNSEPVILSWSNVQRRIAHLIKADEFFTQQEKTVLEHNQEYRLLDRLRSDCEYFLGAGNRSEKHLWAGSVRAQIAKMRELYDTLPEKPEWLTKETIDDYAERMAPPYLVVAYHHFENGFDDKLDYQTLAEAEKAAQGYVDGTMEGDGFQYDGAAIYSQQTRKYLRVYGNYPDERAHAEAAGRDWVEKSAASTESDIAPADRFHVVSLDQGFYTRYAIWDDEADGYYVELNRLYDSFTEKYGIINSRGNRLAFSDDSSYFLLCALEVMDDDGNFQRKADMFTKRTIQPHRVVTSVDTASEALTLSIAEKAEVNMEYMSSLTGKTAEELASELRGVIFHDPTLGNAEDGMGWVTADEYLSGNVRQKLRQAEAAAAENPAYQVNVEALLAAQPKDLDASEIEVRLGATWIDKSYIKQFMFETFDTPSYLRYSMDVQYSPYTAAWSISNKTRISYNDVAAWNTYGTDCVSAYEILEDSLNLRDVQVFDTIEDADGKKKRVLNAKETTLAAQKQQLIRDAFRDWIWADPQRRQALVRQYNEEMNSTRPREYDGSHIVFAGMNPEITLREHQRNAIAHVLYGGNTLLAHEVGAGKTFEMVAAAMESKRLGLCQKSIFVVPNHLTEQWASEFLRLYPSANILVAKQRDFETKNRKKFCARIATGDYDAVIIGHSQFEKIPISKQRQEQLLQDQIAEISMGISELKESGGEKFSVKELERTKRSLESRLEKLRADDKKDDVVTFEQLGVDRMFVDEAHNYKNLFLYTKMRNVAGLSTTDAQKSSDMFGKCRYMDELTGNRGVVFATGTPVSNSMTELYTMQRYLQYARLEEMHMTHFDCWASRFGETVTALELAPEGKGYRPRTRFSRFFNLPELMNLFKEVADIKTADQLHLPVPEVEYHNVVAEQEVFRDWLKGHSPEEILNHAYEYTVREDILLSLEYHDLSDDQADALMKSPSPLADVFQDFEKLETSHMETVWDCLEGRADTLLEEQRRTLRETPVYPYPASYAHEHGELNQYRTSNEANMACKKAIEGAIRDHYRGYSLDGKAAVAEVVRAFGTERTMYILANTVRQKDWDGRISPSNKDWAKSIPIQKNPDVWGEDRNVYLIVNSHPGLTDLFVNAFRKEYCQQQEKDIKPSVRAKLQNQPAKNSPKISANLKGQER